VNVLAEAREDAVAQHGAHLGAVDVGDQEPPGVGPDVDGG
jgi:hypothetical protein